MIEPLAVEKAEEIDSPAGKVRRTLATLGLDYSLLLFFVALFLVLGIIYGASFHVLGEGSIAIAVGAPLGLVAIRFFYRARAILSDIPGARSAFRASAGEIVRDWGPLIGITIIFENLHNFTGTIRKFPIDDQLYALDLKWFGVEPTVWIGKFAHPVLTDYFSFAYGLYFILPMVLMVMMAMRGRRHDFREMGSAIVIHMCVGFLLFIVFPAGPPRFYKPLLHGQFQPPFLSSALGLWEWSQTAWDSANSVVDHSSFPSMHCCLATLTLLYAWRFGDAVWPHRKRLYFWVAMPLVVSLWLSTIYLRHHWVPDCLAGIALGIICFVITPKLRKVWPHNQRA